MLPDSNQQSNTSAIRRIVPPAFDGHVISSTLSRCRSCSAPTGSPASAVSCATECTQTMSLGSLSQRHTGSGVPQ